MASSSIQNASPNNFSFAFLVAKLVLKYPKKREIMDKAFTVGGILLVKQEKIDSPIMVA